MAGFDLSTIAIREPACLVRDPLGTPQYFWAQESFDLRPVIEYFDVPHIAHDVPEKRMKSLHWEIDTTFVGEWENLATLFPNLGQSLGNLCLGTSDVAWALITESGKQWLFHRGGIIERPTIMAKVGGSLLGPVKLAFTCASDKDPGDSGAFYTYSTGASYPSYTNYSAAAVLTLAPALTYGSYLDATQSEDGVEIQFGQTNEPLLVNGLIRDWRITAQEFTARLKPLDWSFADIVTAAGYNQAMGTQLPTDTFIAAYSGFYAAIRGATVEQAEFRFSGRADLVQGVVFRGSQTYSTGSEVAQGYVGTAAP